MELERLLRNNFNEKELMETFKSVIDMEPLKIKILKKVKCKKCGWCCKNQSAMLTPEDIKRLMVYFKCSFEELSDRYLNKTMKIPYLRSPCPFLDSENRCIVYYARPKVCKIYPFTDFFMVVKPCLLGEEVLDIMVKSGRFISNNGQHDNSHLQQLYNDRLDILNSITGMEPSKGAEYNSVYMDKDMLGKLMRILKHKN